MKPHIVAFIFARGGSKGVARKNLRELGGLPLLAHAIDCARASRGVERIVVSTDDAEIAAVALARGADVPFRRPPELARDDTPEWLAWQHAIRALGEAPGARAIDVFLSVPTTAPLREPGDLDACVEALLEGDADYVITVTPAHRNPYFNMVTLDEHRRASLVIAPTQAISGRQQALAVYDMTTVGYAARPEFILKASSGFAGRVKAVIVPPERALDIDTELDFVLAEALLARRRSSVLALAKVKGTG